MQWFITDASNRPGEFSRQAGEIARRGINLANVVCLGMGDRGAAAFYAEDEAGLRSALNDAGIGFREVAPVTARLEDRPGTAADAAKRLGDAGVNIELLVPMEKDGTTVKLAIGVDNEEQARNALGELATPSTASASSRSGPST